VHDCFDDFYHISRRDPPRGNRLAAANRNQALASAMMFALIGQQRLFCTTEDGFTLPVLHCTEVPEN
jgi:hypothetical protein